MSESDENDVKAKNLKSNLIIATAVIFLVVAVGVYLAYGINISKAVVVIIAVIIITYMTRNIWKTITFEQFKKGVAIISFATAGGFIIFLFDKLLVIVPTDETIISPFVTMIVLNIASIITTKYITPKNENRKIYYGLALVISTYVYSFFFHNAIWQYTFVSSSLISICAFLIYKSIRRLESDKIHSRAGKRHKLLSVMFLASKKTWVMPFLLFVDAVIVPTMLVLYFDPFIYWHFMSVVSTYVFSLYLWYQVWYLLNINDIEMNFINPEQFFKELKLK